MTTKEASAYDSLCVHSSTRVDEGRKCGPDRVTTKACFVVAGRGEACLLPGMYLVVCITPAAGPELRQGRSWRKSCYDNKTTRGARSKIILRVTMMDGVCVKNSSRFFDRQTHCFAFVGAPYTCYLLSRRSAWKFAGRAGCATSRECHTSSRAPVRRGRAFVPRAQK